MRNRNMRRSIIIVVLFLIFKITSAAVQNDIKILQTVTIPGAVIPVAIRYIPVTVSVQNIEAEFLGNKFKFFHPENSADYEAASLIAVPLSAQIGQYSLRIFLHKSKRQKILLASEIITITAYSFPERRMQFRELSKQELRRYQQEKAEIESILSKTNPADSLVIPFAKPLDTLIVTSEFGTIRRSGGAIGRHWGADFRVDIGDEVKAINGGNVVLAKETLLGGNTVIIDHKNGIYSVYMHLSAILVVPGDNVSMGRKIGLAGSSGRATGLNLHLGVYINGIAVNPVEILKTRLNH